MSAITNAPPTKKRRTFFSSLNLPSLFIPAQPAPSSRAVSRNKILAPLQDPDHRASTPSDRGLRVRQPRKSGESQNGTGATDTKDEVNTQSDGDNKAGDGRRRSLRERKPINLAVDDDSAYEDDASTQSPKSRTKSNSRLKLNVSSPKGETARNKTNTPPRKRQPANLVTPKSKLSSANTAVGAQSSNERLALAMQLSMRATLEGRAKPYMRVPVWSDRDITPSAPGRKGKGRAVKTKVYGRPKGKGKAVTTTRIKLNISSAKPSKKRTRDASESEEELDDEDIVKGETVETVTEKAKGSGSRAKKEYMASGFYCQNANAKSPYKLVSRVLKQNGQSSKVSAKSKGKAKARANKGKGKAVAGEDGERLNFPPLPYDYGNELFFGEEHEFKLPWNIHKDAQDGILDGKKKPAPYQKLRGNVYPDRARMTAEHRAVCRCPPESDCGEDCINRIMSYLCGKDCPCGEKCTNKSLAKRPTAPTKVFYTGSRGFGLQATEDIKAGDFVTDYRGEVISLNTFYERIKTDYVGQKNFYALAYDQDEVIDAGMRGNDARFINHGCNPNLEVRKYQTLGDGLEEYEIGMWATKDIAKGEELFYDYNFDCFGQAKDELRTHCRCGAPNCVGFLGRKPGEKSAKEIALELEAKAINDAAAAARKAKRGIKGSTKKVGRKRAPIQFNGAVSMAQKAAAKRGRPGRKPKAVIAPESANSAPGLEHPSTGASSSTTTAVPVTPGGVRASSTLSDDASSAKRKSGWSDWLLKRAGEKPRTIEEWHEERMKRRRGITWMNEMINQFGLLPSPGVPTPDAYGDGRKPAGSTASFANSLAATGFGPGPDAIKNLGGPGHAYKTAAWEKAKREGSTSLAVPAVSPSLPSESPTKDKASQNDNSVVLPRYWKNRSQPNPLEDMVRPSASTSDLKTAAGEDRGADRVVRAKSEGEDEHEVHRETEKKKAIAKRNGAPMGWVYVAPGADVAEAGAPRGSRLINVVEENLDRSARRSRSSLARDAVRAAADPTRM